jgi:diguanylate cyclase
MPAIGLLLLCLVFIGAASPAMAENASLVDTRLAEGLQVDPPQYMLGRLHEGFEQAQGDDWPWQPLTRPSLGRQPEGAWVRFALRNTHAVNTQWYLQLKWPVLDRVTVRLFYPERQSWSEPLTAGGSVPMDRRPMKTNNLVFPLDLQPGEGAVVYLHLLGHEMLVMPLSLADASGFHEDRIIDTALFSLFYGGMLVIVLYNISLMIFTRDLSYLLYVVYLFSAMFYITTMSGYGQLLLWPGAAPVTARFYALSAGLCFLTPLLFVYRFLEVRRYGGWIWRTTVVLGCYWTVVCLTALLFPGFLHLLFMDYVALPYCLISMAIILTLWARGNVSARLFSIAWVALLGFTMVHLLALAGHVPLTRLTLNGQLLGMFIEFVLLSMALAERINLERNKRIAAQRLALSTSQSLAEERQRHLQAQQQANEVLEARVAARTQALEEVRLGLELANAELVRLSDTDPLTLLANRRQFDRLFDEEIRRARRSSTPLSVLLCDIDHFKAVNDVHGHSFGDECLRQAAAVLQRHCQRAGDIAARYGGEEFVIVLPGLDGPEAGSLAERIRADIERLDLEADGEQVKLTISIGISALLRTATDEAPLDILNRADEALYEAKRRGRNCVVLAAIPADSAASPG